MAPVLLPFLQDAVLPSTPFPVEEGDQVKCLEYIQALFALLQRADPVHRQLQAVWGDVEFWGAMGLLAWLDKATHPRFIELAALQAHATLVRLQTAGQNGFPSRPFQDQAIGRTTALEVMSQCANTLYGALGKLSKAWMDDDRIACEQSRMRAMFIATQSALAAARSGMALAPSARLQDDWLFSLQEEHAAIPKGQLCHQLLVEAARFGRDWWSLDEAFFPCRTLLGGRTSSDVLAWQTTLYASAGIAAALLANPHASDPASTGLELAPRFLWEAGDGIYRLAKARAFGTGSGANKEYKTASKARIFLFTLAFRWARKLADRNMTSALRDYSGFDSVYSLLRVLHAAIHHSNREGEENPEYPGAFTALAEWVLWYEPHLPSLKSEFDEIREISRSLGYTCKPDATIDLREKVIKPLLGDDFYWDWQDGPSRPKDQDIDSTTGGDRREGLGTSSADGKNKGNDLQETAKIVTKYVQEVLQIIEEDLFNRNLKRVSALVNALTEWTLNPPEGALTCLYPRTMPPDAALPPNTKYSPLVAAKIMTETSWEQLGSDGPTQKDPLDLWLMERADWILGAVKA